MNSYQYITQHPERTISILGITFDQFSELSTQAMNREKAYQAQQEQQKHRVNQKGALMVRQFLIKTINCFEEIRDRDFYLSTKKRLIST